MSTQTIPVALSARALATKIQAKASKHLLQIRCLRNILN